MKKYQVVNILDMAEAIGEMNLRQRLADFECPMNSEIEHFVINNAIDFAKKKLSITYFVVNEAGEIAAVFTLTHKPIEIKDTGLSNAKRKKISRYAIFDYETQSYTVSAFLIAQLFHFF